jgi:hypothetical protein
VAVDRAGQEVTFDATAPEGAAAVTISTQQLNGVACPSTTQCTAIGNGGSEVTFDPLAAGSAHAAVVGATADRSLTAVACSSTAQCTAVGNEEEVTFDPGAPANATRAALGTVFYDVSCPLSTQCTAGGYRGMEVTFDPASPGTPVPFQIESRTIESIACPTMHQCTGLSNFSDNTPFHERNEGQEVTFDPTEPRATAPRTILNRGRGLGSDLEGVTCTSRAQCIAVGEEGYVVVFKPHLPIASAVATRVDVADRDRLRSVVCPSGAQCTAINWGGHEVTFNPASPAGTAPILIDPRGSLAGIACPSSEQCTAVGEGGGEVTFDPSSPGGAVSSVIDAGHGLRGIACPAISECIAVDDDGSAVTFDPTSPSGASVQRIGHEALSDDEGTSRGYASIACRGLARCTAVGDRVPHVKMWTTQVVTFEPGSTVAPKPAETVTPLASVACPSDTQCTAVGENEQITFDPALSEPLVAEAVPGVLWPGQLTSVACPTVELCVAVDSTGRETST